MSAEHQLERSVLERKERDELQAIAQAMELNLPARARKADIIDQILEATGVTQSASYVSGSRGSLKEPDRALFPAQESGGHSSEVEVSGAAENTSLPTDGESKEVAATTDKDEVVVDAGKGQLFNDGLSEGGMASSDTTEEMSNQESAPVASTKPESSKKTRSSTRSKATGSRRSSGSKKNQDISGQLPEFDADGEKQISGPSESLEVAAPAVRDGAYVSESSSEISLRAGTSSSEGAIQEDVARGGEGQDSTISEARPPSEEASSQISLNGAPATKEGRIDEASKEESIEQLAASTDAGSKKYEEIGSAEAVRDAQNVGAGVAQGLDTSAIEAAKAANAEIPSAEQAKPTAISGSVEMAGVVVAGQVGGNGSGEVHVADERQSTQKAEVATGDSSNRRSRRRRGRDRDRSDRDSQSQGAASESQYQGELIPVKGLIDLRDEGYGFVRASGYLPSSKDTYVAVSQVKRFGLRKGDFIEGAARPAASNEKFPALIRIDSVSGLEPEQAKNRPRFEDLTPLFPDSRLRMEIEGDPDNLTARIVDLLCPIGKGQRGLIVSPPKAGKTTVMKQIAHSIEINNPEVYLMVLLVDERPEEVTDMRRSVKGEVVASTFDRPADEHTAVAEMAMEHAKRLVEVGRDVVIILDGITRLARAYNLAQPATGRIMSGGVDSGALYPPKKFFGAARNIEEGGSLTILATALVETGSRMDEVIFEEFKGTGNMELRLDRKLAERRIYPAIDVNASSTRHEELLFDRSQLQQVWKLRRVLNALAADGNTAPGLELLMDKIKSTKGNDEFLAEIAKGPSPPV